MLVPDLRSCHPGTPLRFEAPRRLQNIHQILAPRGQCETPLLVVDEFCHALRYCLTMRLTYRRRGGRWSGEKICELVQSAERKARAAVRCRRLVSSHAYVPEISMKGATTKTAERRRRALNRGPAKQALTRVNSSTP